MNDDFYDFEPEPLEPSGRWDEAHSGQGLFDSLRNLWQWDGLAAEIGQESQARVAFVGLAGAGKSLLFNRLRGWVISGEQTMVVTDPFELEPDLKLESLGVFVLADLPALPPEAGFVRYDLMSLLSEPSLIVYLLDGAVGVTATDYRWIATLRASGKPLLIALNKCDLVEDMPATMTEASEKLGMPVIPISALEGENVEDLLLPGMLDMVPRLAVPLGRELRSLRRLAARRIIRQAALLVGVVGVQPVPLLDLPFQVMIQVGVVMRVGAAYGTMPTGSLNREVIGAIVSSLGMRYLAVSLVKLIPIIGWAMAGALSGAMTVLIGEAAIRYYEAGATVPLREIITKSKKQWQNGRQQTTRRFKKGWGKRPRLTTVVPPEDEEIPITQFESDENSGGSHES